MDFLENDQKIWLEDESGKVTAYVEFPEVNGVGNVLRGQGIGGKLLSALVKKMEKEGKKLELTCSYAIDWFNKNRGHENVLVDAEKEYAKAAKKG